MNPYFLLLYVMTAMYRWLDISNVIHFGIAAIKNIKLLGSMLLPDPKGTVEHLRGGILKVNYIDPQRIASSSGEKSYVLLPYSIPALSWTKVFAITNEQYEKGEPTFKPTHVATEKLSGNQIENFLQASHEMIEKHLDKEPGGYRELRAIDTDLLDDILDVGETKAAVKSKSAKISLKAFEKTDVTEFIEMVAGPGKDFFGSSITPAKLNPDYRYLIFHFHKRTITFAANDDLNRLLNH